MCMTDSQVFFLRLLASGIYFFLSVLFPWLYWKSSTKRGGQYWFCSLCGHELHEHVLQWVSGRGREGVVSESHLSLNFSHDYC